MFQYCKPLCGKHVVIKLPKDLIYITSRLVRSCPVDHSAKFEWPDSAASKEEPIKDFPNDSSQRNELGILSNYDFSKGMMKKLQKAGIERLFEVQYKTFHHIKGGQDAIVQARTGTGKTLAFVLPLLEKLNERGEFRGERTPQVLTLAPTKELAIQTTKQFNMFKSDDVLISSFYGGTSPSCSSDIQSGIDVLVGTPGYILDRLIESNLNISTLKHVVLSEVDHMLDEGSQEELDEILRFAYRYNKPQTLLFSATAPPWVKKITTKYTNVGLKRFNLIEGPVKGAGKVVHKSIMCSSSNSDINSLICKLISVEHGKTIVFIRTKKNAEKAADHINYYDVDCGLLTEDIQRYEREKTLKDFGDGIFNCLVTTDIAAKGLDIPDVDLVIQISPPADTRDYIYRAGRIGRAGNGGQCIVIYRSHQAEEIQLIEKRAGIKFLEAGSVEYLLDSSIRSNTGSALFNRNRSPKWP